MDPKTLELLEALRREMQAAIDSPILFEIARRAGTQGPEADYVNHIDPGSTTSPVRFTTEGQNDPEQQQFFHGVANTPTRVHARLQPPRSPYELLAGSIIPAALLTAINSDLPGNVIGHVTANVYDTVSGRHLLVPQGSRLIGRYNSEVLNGQNRVLIAWQRLILPNGYSILLDAMPGTDAAPLGGRSTSRTGLRASSVRWGLGVRRIGFL